MSVEKQLVTSLQEAFRRLAELAGDRWDGVDAQEYVNQIRGALPLSCENDVRRIVREEVERGWPTGNRTFTCKHNVAGGCKLCGE